MKLSVHGKDVVMLVASDNSNCHFAVEMEDYDVIILKHGKQTFAVDVRDNKITVKEIK